MRNQFGGPKPSRQWDLTVFVQQNITYIVSLDVSEYGRYRLRCFWIQFEPDIRTHSGVGRDVRMFIIRICTLYRNAYASKKTCSYRRIFLLSEFPIFGSDCTDCTDCKWNSFIIVHNIEDIYHHHMCILPPPKWRVMAIKHNQTAKLHDLKARTGENIIPSEEYNVPNGSQIPLSHVHWERYGCWF